MLAIITLLAITCSTSSVYANVNQLSENVNDEVQAEIQYVENKRIVPKNDEQQYSPKELQMIEYFNSTSALSSTQESEPNDTRNTADSLEDSTSMYATIDSLNDIDFYSITFTGTGTANFFVGDIPANCDYDLELLSNTGTVLETSDRSGNTDELISDYPVQSGEKYYLKVYSNDGYSSNNEYFVRVKLYEESVSLEWPVPASHRITQGYSSSHKAIDIGASTPGEDGDEIVAAYDALVTRAGWSESYGWVVYLISKDKIDGDYIQTIYAHMKASPLVEEDIVDGIEARTVLGGMGNTGQSAGVHLHYEMTLFDNRETSAIKGSPVNPMNYYPNMNFVATDEATDSNNCCLVGDVEDDVFYSMEEIRNMTQEELDTLGIPYEK